MGTTVLVTGANSGIGRATVLHLAELGLRPIGAARTPEGVDEVVAAAAEAGQTVTAVQLDVTDAAACGHVVDEHRPDAVVNNAGYFNAAPWRTSTVVRWTSRFAPAGIRDRTARFLLDL